MDELFGVVLSTGMVSRLRCQFTQSVQPAMAAAQAYVQQQSVLGMDETRFRQANSDGPNGAQRQGWLWVMTTTWVSYFAIRLSRRQAVAQSLLGEAYAGIVGSDRYSSYNYLPLAQRQVCWAHLKRDFTAMAERTGQSATIGHALLAKDYLHILLKDDLIHPIEGALSSAFWPSPSK